MTRIFLGWQREKTINISFVNIVYIVIYPLTILYFFSILLYEINNQDTICLESAH